MNKRKKYIIIYIFLILTITLLSLRKYILDNFSMVTFEQLLYSVINTEGGSTSSIIDGLFYVLLSILIGLVFFTLFLSINEIFIYKKIVLKFKIKKEFYIQIFPINIKISYFVIVFILSIVYFFNGIGLMGFVNDRFDYSNFYEKNYVEVDKVKITFPDKKRNLIYIFLESMENSALSKANGGTADNSYIPELEQLALENLNFSNSNNLGGAYQVNNTGWTIAGLIAQTSGTTLNIGIDGNEYKGYSSNLPGVTSIGEILSDNGYINYFMLGSDSKYGGRREYFKKHGYYEIFDYNIAIEKQKIKDDYYVWWGYEDKKLFEFAQEELLKLSNGDQPFNFTMLTVDTHFVDGYLDETCKQQFDEKYANVFNCSNNQVYDFVNWIKKQDFYENTTIVLSGDHLTMQSDFFKYDDDYERTVYNTFINSAIDTEYNKNRKFSTLDMFPTTLASLGVEIKGDRLGLGTNLFSGKKTLLEKYGLDYVNKELTKNSKYYNNVILGDTYVEMLLDKEGEK